MGRVAVSGVGQADKVPRVMVVAVSSQPTVAITNNTTHTSAMADCLDECE